MHALRKEIIDGLTYEEAIALERDLSRGAPGLQSQLRTRIDAEKRTHASSCAVCGASLRPSQLTYTLLFGPSDFLKRASCCGMDCMEYFFADLKDLRREP